MNWPERLSAEERSIIEAAGWGRRQGFGRSPAVLVVDVTYGFTGDAPEPIMQGIERYPTHCGEQAWPAMEAMNLLLDEARRGKVPVFYSRPEYLPDGSDLGSWSWKLADVSSAMAVDRRANEITALVAPQAGDVVIAKKKPSAFFGTPLVSLLLDRGVDQLLVVGCVTSGCVRATVLDAFSYNLRVAVVQEGTFDRVALSHEMALFEMDAKYADVVPLQPTLAYLRGLAQTGGAA